MRLPLTRIIYDIVDHKTYVINEPSFFYGRDGMRIRYQYFNGKEMP